MIFAKPAAPARSRFDAAVEFNRAICREHFRLRLRIATGPAFPATRPGQFIQLGCRPPEGNGASDTLDAGLEWMPERPPVLTQPELCAPMALLRRPFSLAGRGDDERGTWIDVIHRVVGIGTAWLAGLRPGDRVDFIGPLGNWFFLPEGKSNGLLVGGGVGLPPMFYLAEALRDAGWSATAFVGALCRDLLAVTFNEGCEACDVEGNPSLSAQEFARLGYRTVVTTDDGSFGLKGRITAGLERTLANLSRDDARQTIIFVCGPDRMMHAVAALAAKFGVDCRVCLEQAMACGMSTCQSCVVRIEDTAKPQAFTAAPENRPWRYKLACTDGPVFDAREVVWT
jgi:dihydroorotate dehydrogenase electron transfer subunit